MEFYIKIYGGSQDGTYCYFEAKTGVCSLVVMIPAFQAGGPGLFPGERTHWRLSLLINIKTLLIL